MNFTFAAKVMSLPLLLCIFFQTVISKSTSESQEYDKTIIVFGGNGFIGASTVEKLLRANYSLVLINRGNWYWNTGDTIKPYVRHIKCDRMQSLQRCAGLQHYLWSLDAPSWFEAIVDFSAYHSFQITETLHAFKGKVRRYVFISSDSVYEVCNKSHSNPSREEDAVRPLSVEDQKAYSLRDSYGNRKLLCEEELQQQSISKDGIPYVALRLPDVIGPRDNTYRWWIYQLWIRLSDYLSKQLSVPVHIMNKPLSFVFVDDVADVIVELISVDLGLFNQAYNLAMRETPSLVNVLHGIMSVLDIDDVSIKEDASDEPFHLFPSVKLGTIDISKAVRMLTWNPTPWLDVLDTTVMFYEHAIIKPEYETARRDIIRTLQEHFTSNPASVMQGLKDIYKLGLYNDHHDEL